jgi:hypothetical protein
MDDTSVGAIPGSRKGNDPAKMPGKRGASESQGEPILSCAGDPSLRSLASDVSRTSVMTGARKASVELT